MSYIIPRYTISLIREGCIKTEEYPVFTGSRGVFEQFKDLLAQFDREHFLILAVDTKNRLIGLHDVSVGSLNGAYVHPREVFKPAVLNNANGIIGIHNHPSGDPTPSREDNELTERLAKAGQVLGIKMLDHVIFGESTYYSYADAGFLPLKSE